MSEDVLAKWEAEANENITRGYLAESVSMPSLNWAEINDKILKLIEMVREKDRALQYYCTTLAGNLLIDWNLGTQTLLDKKAKEALALTERLK